MKPSMHKILFLLRKRKRRGVTFDDVPRGTCITKRIAELREMGYEISTTMEDMSNGGRRARWHLLAEPATSQVGKQGNVEGGNSHTGLCA